MGKPQIFNMPDFGKNCNCCTKVKVICIGDPSGLFTDELFLLTNGKIYDAIDMKTQEHVIKTEDYNLVDDQGYRSNYKKKYFITLAEYRQQQIEDILN